jgi:hypothetical protein
LHGTVEEIAHANKAREFGNTVFWQQGALPDRCLSDAHAFFVTLSALLKARQKSGGLL